jgi:hypothetical protein
MKGKLVGTAPNGDFRFQLEDGTTRDVPKHDPRIVAALQPRKIDEVDAATYPVVLVLPLAIDF